MPAPDAFLAAIKAADRYCQKHGAAEKSGSSFGMIPHTDRLAVKRHDDEAQCGRALPADPGRDPALQAITIGKLGSSPHRAQKTAPDPPEDDDRQKDKREPDAPEQILQRQRSIRQRRRFRRRIGQQKRQAEHQKKHEKHDALDDPVIRARPHEECFECDEPVWAFGQFLRLNQQRWRERCRRSEITMTVNLCHFISLGTTTIPACKYVARPNWNEIPINQDKHSHI
ncbi:hypothetical protein D3C80_625140 [compost metagenome]